MSTTVSVIVCCYHSGRWERLVAAIRSIREQLSESDELVVVADHNAELEARLGRAFPGVAVIGNRFAPGLSGARNAGVSASIGELVVFVDDDAELRPGAIAQLRETMGDPLVLGAVASIEPVWTGSAPRWFPDAFLWVVGCTYEGLKSGPVRNVIGAAMCVRRAVFERIGGFVDGIGRVQSGLPLGCEETELCLRANAAFRGHTFVFEPRARCGHHVPRNRMTWRYFTIRCYAEGVSKAHISALQGARAALSAEWIYVRDTVLLAALREIGRGRADKAFALVFGLAVTTAGYVGARARSSLTHRARGGERRLARTRSPASPMSVSVAQFSNASGKFGALLRPLSGLIFNAGAVAGGNLVSAVLGFGYWWLAARRFSPEEVGLAASAISVMNLLAQLGEFGLGPLLLSEVPKQARGAGALIAAALAATLVCCLGFAFIYVVGARLMLHDVGIILGSTSGSVLFVVGVVLTGATIVIDQALIAQMRSDLQALRLGGFAVVKLVFLAAASVLISGSATAIITTWIAGALASLGLLVAVSAHSRRTIWGRPRVSMLRPIFGKIIGHHGLNVALQAPLLLMPFVVTQMLSARVNAAFYAAWAILGVVSLVPAALSSVVVTVGRREPGAFASRFAFSLCVSLAVCGTASLAFWLFSPAILALFNPEYAAIAGTGLAVLGVGTIGLAFKFHYVALGRYAESMALTTLVATAGGVMELVLSAYGAARGGLDGLATGWVIAVFLEVVPMAALTFAATRSARVSNASLRQGLHAAE